MPVIGKRLGAVLGPRGRMPRPSSDRGSDEPDQLDAEHGPVRSRDKRTFHAAIVRGHAAGGSCGEPRRPDAPLLGKLERGPLNIQSAYLKTTMGPAVRYI